MRSKTANITLRMLVGSYFEQIFLCIEYPMWSMCSLDKNSSTESFRPSLDVLHCFLHLCRISKTFKDIFSSSVQQNLHYITSCCFISVIESEGRNILQAKPNTRRALDLREHSTGSEAETKGRQTETHR